MEGLKILIQCDVDSTLYDADKLFAQIAEDQGINWVRNAKYWFAPSALTTHVGTTAKREDLAKIFRKAHSKEFVLKQKPYPWAAQTLARIAEMYDDVEIAYVSDRNEQGTSALREWLEANGFLFNEDQHVATTKDKRHWMRERKPEVVIDDRVRTMLMARYELGSYVLSLQHAHNINLTGEVDHIYIAKDWQEIDMLLHETVLPKIREKSLSLSNQEYYTEVR